MNDNARESATGTLSIPEMRAWPITSVDDATVHLYGAETPLFKPPWELAGHAGVDGGFKVLSEFLCGPDVNSEPVFGTASRARSRLSAAGEVTIVRPDGVTKELARGLVCFSERRRGVSVTLRSLRRAVESAGEPKPDRLNVEQRYRDKWQGDVEWRNGYSAPNKRAAGKARSWFTLGEQCRVIAESVFRYSADGEVIPAAGLVVLTGATNSAKSKIARGLIHDYVQSLVRRQPSRRPHLVTFEDPIEAYWVEGKIKKRRSLTESESSSRAERRRAKLSESLRLAPRSLLARWNGIDYTPRERGVDVWDLRQAFADALRQTPSVFYVGEVRDTTEWAEVLDFAGTGHLVVTTAHASSLLEAMVKLFSAVGASTPSERRRFASRICAVIHLRPELALPGAKLTSLQGRTLLLPSVWRRTEPGLATLAANGLGAIVPQCPKKPDDGESDTLTSCLGRRWFLERLIERVGVSEAERSAEWGIEPVKLANVAQALRRRATELDLLGE